jgi:hypothetical protein
MNDTQHQSSSTDIKKMCPYKIDLGAVFTDKPKDHKKVKASEFKTVERELVRPPRCPHPVTVTSTFISTVTFMSTVTTITTITTMTTVTAMNTTVVYSPSLKLIYGCPFLAGSPALGACFSQSHLACFTSRTLTLGSWSNLL